MQHPTAAPRDHLTRQDVERLLAAPSLFVGTGLDLLSPDLRPVRDLTPHLWGGSVRRDLYATVHGSCSLQLDLELRWGLDYVRPYMVLTDGRTVARFDQGVYVPTSPRRRIGATPTTYDVTGYDLLYLLDRQVGASYSVPAGTPVLQAARAAITASGVQSPVLFDLTAAATTLPAVASWPLVPQTNDPDDDNTPTTWLRIVNDLLAQVNYRGLWADELGRYRSEPYRAPVDRGTEWAFTDQPTGVPLGQDRDYVPDVYGVPNRWVFRASNPPEGVVPSEANGLVYIVNLPPEHALSAANRNGLVWPVTFDYDAATPAALKGLGDRRVQTDLAWSARFELTTGVFPLAGHADVYAYRDGEAGMLSKVQAVRSELDLFGADMTWTWEVVD